MTGTVFIMFLAAMELMGTINTILALYFTQIFEHFGFGRHSWKWCKFFGALATMNGNVIWFTTGMIAVTRAVGLTHKKCWQKVCTKTNLGLMFTVPWFWSLMLSLPTFVDPSVEYEFNCQTGACDRLSTGQMNLVPQVILQVTTMMVLMIQRLMKNNFVCFRCSHKPLVSSSH